MKKDVSEEEKEQAEAGSSGEEDESGFRKLQNQIRGPTDRLVESLGKARINVENYRLKTETLENGIRIDFALRLRVNFSDKPK